jgi:hypothetical protein
VRVRPIERERKLIQILSQDFAERLGDDAAHLESSLVDPKTKPVTYAMTIAYISRLRAHKAKLLEFATTGDGERLSEPGIFEITKWIPELRREKGQIESPSLEQLEDVFGDLYVSVGRTYSETKKLLSEIHTGLPRMQGPPGKRSEAVKMLDAIIANGWSYSRTAKEMCDCGKARHDDKCTDLVRKRIRELESFLDEQGIEYQRRSIPGRSCHS